MASGTSYNGWPAHSDPSRIDVVRFEPIPGFPLPGGVRDGDVKTVLTYVARRLHAEVEPIDETAIRDDWGYAFKYSANSPHLLSCHASATAFDWNATQHPNGRSGTFTAVQVRGIRAILTACEGLVRWLGDARVPDEMHFEIRGTPSQIAALARRLRGAPAPVPPPTTQELSVTDINDIMKKLDDLEARINDVAAGVVIGVSATAELDADLPENAAAELDMLRIAMRGIGAGLNDLLEKNGLPAVDIGKV
jgi:hypothetical protein